MNKSIWMKKQIKRFRSELFRPSIWDKIAENIYIIIMGAFLIFLGIMSLLSVLVIFGIIDANVLKESFPWIN